MSASDAPLAAAAPDARRPRAAVRPVVLLGVAVVLAVASAAAVGADAPAWLTVALTLLAVAATAWAALVTMSRPSRVIAPLAACVLALGNPLVLGVAAPYLQEKVGVVEFRLDRGLVLWGNYPGIAGWEAPTAPERVDTFALAGAVKDIVRDPVDALSDAFGYSWTIGEGYAGLTRIPNGFGGVSMFESITVPPWTTTDFDGSTAQRERLLAETDAAAARLELDTRADPDGDVATGDGTRTWTDGAGTMTLRIDGRTLALSYSGGPFLMPSAYGGEFARAMQAYEGLDLPTPLTVPELP